MKLAIYGIGENTRLYIERIENKHEVLFFVQTNPTETWYRNKMVVSAREIKWDDIDLLIIMPNLRQEIMEYLEKIDTLWEYHKLKTITFMELLYPGWTTLNGIMPYKSLETEEGLRFVFASSDQTIPNEMLKTQKTFSRDEINDFFKLAEKYYGYKDLNDGIFLDIGANVGTTSIYVKKNVNPRLQIYAIEAIKKTYDLLRINTIINEAEDIITSLCGVSDHEGLGKCDLWNDCNYGSACVGEHENGPIKLTTIDNYICEKKIISGDVKYIWMDIEGAEAKALLGAEKLLASSKIPLFQEFNPIKYEEQGLLDKYYELVNKYYDGMVVFYPDFLGGKKLMEIKDIDVVRLKLEENNLCQTNIFFL